MYFYWKIAQGRWLRPWAINICLSAVIITFNPLTPIVAICQLKFVITEIIILLIFKYICRGSRTVTRELATSAYFSACWPWVTRVSTWVSDRWSQVTRVSTCVGDRLTPPTQRIANLLVLLFTRYSKLLLVTTIITFTVKDFYNLEIPFIS